MRSSVRPRIRHETRGRKRRSSQTLDRLVGAPGLEPGTFCSQSRRAPKLRHAPNCLDAITGRRQASNHASVPGDRGRAARAGPAEYDRPFIA